MNKLYTAVGRLQFKSGQNGKRYPSVIVNHKEYILDLQEMTLWSILNWRILSLEEIQTLYEQKEREIGFLTERSTDDCIRRLLQRGLVADGSGETGSDSLYGLLSELYVVPISENPILRLISFIRLTVFCGVPYSVTKRIFSKDQRSNDEKQVMRLANRAMLSTAEIIKCIEQKALDFSSEDELMEILYHDDYTTSENIAEETRHSPECRSVLTSVANLYLRKQIIFERM